MMSPTQRLFAIAMLATLPLLSQPAHAAIATPDQRQVIDRFIAYSSFGSQFAQLPQLVRQQMELGIPRDLPAAERQRVTTLLLRAFEGDKAKNAMNQQLALEYDNTRYLALLQKLETPLLRKLRSMEQTSHEPASRHEMQNFISRLPQNPVTPQRETLVKELLAVNGTIESAIQTRTALHEVVHGLVDNTPQEKKRPQLKDPMEQGRTLAENLRPMVETEALAMALFTYRNASDDEIRQYTGFYNSAAGHWFRLTQQNGWLGALRDIGRDVTWKLQNPDAGDLQTAFEDDLGL